MSEQIHGHAVMEMMLKKDQSFTRETLYEAIVEEFGEEARFHTCSEENMTIRRLIDFLQSRGKFVAKGSGFSTSSEKICNH
jgi:probable metal-binding protein